MRRPDPSGQRGSASRSWLTIPVAARLIPLLTWFPAGSAQAHSFGRVYNLPVPFWLYAWTGIAALLLSFLVAGWFLTRRQDAQAPSQYRIADRPARWLTGLMPVLRIASLGALLLCIVAGFAGPADAYLNVNMTLFWIGFVLAFAYLTALIGDIYAHINPWRTLTDGLSRLAPGLFRGRLNYPAALGCWPALALYMAFIWIELLGHVTPLKLAWMLLAYSGINLMGAWLFGADSWFRQGEFFSVFLRLTGKMAPVAWLPPAHRGGPLRIILRAPFSGLRADHDSAQDASISALLFVLFMLSSTAFDGLHVTQVWMKLFWEQGFAFMQPWLGSNLVEAYPTLKILHQVWETKTLLLSPFLYLACYLACLWLARRLTASPLSLHTLALRFAWTLLPIALVYHISHYYTLILTQGSKLLSLLSDPLGRGWNLFGTDATAAASAIPDMGWVWHTQVGLILGGHIVSVYLAHVEALRSFGSPRQAMLSQIPMLLLMMAFTVFGLWILAQPITGGGPG